MSGGHAILFILMISVIGTIYYWNKMKERGGTSRDRKRFIFSLLAFAVSLVVVYS